MCQREGWYPEIHKDLWTKGFVYRIFKKIKHLVVLKSDQFDKLGYFLGDLVGGLGDVMLNSHGKNKEKLGCVCIIMGLV